MGILVCYDDFTYDVVTDHQLDDLLEKGNIIGYDRSGEWVKMEGLPVSPPKQKRDSGRNSPSPTGKRG